MSDRRSNIPWSVPVTVADIPDEGVHYELVPDAPTLEAIANHAGLRKVSKLRAVFDLKRQGEAVAVQGEVTAQVGQTCVVMLEPLDNEVRETVNLIFAPSSDDLDTDKRRRKRQEPPEPLQDGVIDLGNIATEFLILGLDPYPRKPGAEFVTAVTADDSPHPFAGLAALKKPS